MPLTLFGSSKGFTHLLTFPATKLPLLPKASLRVSLLPGVSFFQSKRFVRLSSYQEHVLKRVQNEAKLTVDTINNIRYDNDPPMTRFVKISGYQDNCLEKIKDNIKCNESLSTEKKRELNSMLECIKYNTSGYYESLQTILTEKMDRADFWHYVTRPKW